MCALFRGMRTMYREDKGKKQGRHRNALKEVDESDYFNFLDI
jgi:hypothetical protein